MHPFRLALAGRGSELLLVDWISAHVLPCHRNRLYRQLRFSDVSLRTFGGCPVVRTNRHGRAGASRQDCSFIRTIDHQDRSYTPFQENQQILLVEPRKKYFQPIPFGLTYYCVRAYTIMGGNVIDLRLTLPGCSGILYATPQPSAQGTVTDLPCLTAACDPSRKLAILRHNAEA